MAAAAGGCRISSSIRPRRCSRRSVRRCKSQHAQGASQDPSGRSDVVTQLRPGVVDHRVLVHQAATIADLRVASLRQPGERRAARDARLCREAQDLVQNRLFPGASSGQNCTPHHSQATTIPCRLRPRSRRAVSLMASRPAGEIAASPRRWARLALTGSREATKAGLSARVRRALATTASRVVSATSPLRGSPCCSRYWSAVIPWPRQACRPRCANRRPHSWHSTPSGSLSTMPKCPNPSGSPTRDAMRLWWPTLSAGSALASTTTGSRFIETGAGLPRSVASLPSSRVRASYRRRACSPS